MSSETSGSRVRRIFVRRLVFTGIDKAAIWMFGWQVAWTLFIIACLLIPDARNGSVFGVVICGIGLLAGLSMLSILRKSAQHAQNPARINQLVKWSYGVFSIGFLAMILSTVLWIINLIRTN